MKQAPMFDGMSFDVPTFGEDVLAPAKVDVRWGQIVQTLMVTLMDCIARLLPFNAYEAELRY